jgi:beta-glucosidase
VEYRESVYVGYRFFDSVDKEVLFPFGHGLSYTTFEYGDLSIKTSHISESETLALKLNVKNTGTVAGKEIVQLYVRPTAPTVFRPEKELKGFHKIDLDPGEEKEVSFDLNRRAFAYYCTTAEDWVVESGEYQILIGSSSGDIRCQGSVQVKSIQPDLAISERDSHPVYASFPADAEINQKDFELLLGHEVPENLPEKKGEYSFNTPIGDLSGSLAGSRLIHYLESQAAEMLQHDPDSTLAMVVGASIKGLPLRAIARLAGERINQKMMEGLLIMVNGRFIWGLFKVLIARRDLDRS